MKLIIQIPCFNEEKTLPLVFADLPKKIIGIDIIEYQVVDDGSKDGTIEVAKKLGFHHVISLKKHRGLAAAFKAGVDHALENGADILVNTDGDNQYDGNDIPKLIAKMFEENAELVIGCRPIDNHPEFSFLKKKLQKIGSWFLRKISNTDVRDAASGFRAYSKESLLHLNIYTKFSYCMETLIQAGYNNIKVATVDINVNPKTRESRLFSNNLEYLWKQGKTITHLFLLYRSKKFFNFIWILFLLASVILVLRYLFIVKVLGSAGNLFWPSVIFSGILLALSFIFYITGIIADLIASSRKLNEEILYRIRKKEIEDKNSKNREK